MNQKPRLEIEVRTAIKKIKYQFKKRAARREPVVEVSSGPIPLVICAVYKNEAPYLREWIEFHLREGFQKIYLIDNHSEDTHLQVLQTFVDDGLVNLSKTANSGMNTRIQAQEYNRVLDTIRNEQGEHCWVAFIDIDEYLFAVEGEPVPDLLQPFEGKRLAGVLVSWLMFGTSGVKALSAETPMIEQLTRRAPMEHNENNNFKCVVYLANVFEFFEGPHRPLPKGNSTFSYSDGVAFNEAERERHHFPLRINHYWYRSEEYYYQQKRTKRKAFGDVREKELEEWHIQRCNEVEDRVILDRKKTEE